jgi:signal transduction histidine kinase
MTKIPDVAWTRVTGFVRQHTHDLRNELNGLDLEAALLSDIVTDPEARESVARMRSEIRKIAAHLRTLSAKFAEARPNRVPIAAQEVFLIWQDQLTELAGLEVDWTNHLDGEQVNVDPGILAQALRELLVNAQAFPAAGKLKASAGVEGGKVVFELKEPKKDVIDPATWGLSPFGTTRRGGYGLGLCTVLQAIEANGGTISWHFDCEVNSLVTTVSLPQAEAV